MNIKKNLSVIAGLIIVSILVLFVFISQYDFSDHLLKAADLIYEKTGRKLAINGSTKLKLGFTPRLVINDITFENASWSDTPHMIKAKQFEIELELIELLKKNIIIKRLGIKNSEILVEQNQKGVSNFTFDNKDSKAPEKNEGKDSSPAHFYFNDLFIENCNIRFHDAKTNTSKVLNIKNLQALATDMKSPISVTILASYDHLNISANGSIDRIRDLFKKEYPYAFDLNTKINESDIKLTGNITNAFQHTIPRIRFDAHSNQLLTASFASPKSDNKEKKAETKLFSSQKINNNFVKDLDLESNISISQLIFDNLTLHKVTSKFTIQNNNLILQPFTASVFNGKLSGNLNIKAIKNKLGINVVLDIQDLDTHLMSNHFKLEKKLKGALNANFSLNGMGSSVSKIMANLNGTSWLSMKDGQVDTGFIQSIGGDFFTNALGALSPFGENVKSSQLNCAVTRIEFKNGIGDIILLLADTPALAASGKGQIDFQNETLDISVKPSPKKGIGTKDIGNINISLSQVAKAFKIAGPLSSPEVEIDNAEATKSILKTAGGVVLFGPIGIIAALVGTNKADQDPCPCALIIVRDGNSKNCETSKGTNNMVNESNSDKESNPIKRIFSIFD